MTKDYKAQERRHYDLQISFSLLSFKNEKKAYEITSPSVSLSIVTIINFEII
jgi:hypothetical protein